MSDGASLEFEPGRLHRTVERGFLAALAAEDWGRHFFVEARLERLPRTRRAVTGDGRITGHAGDRRRLRLAGSADLTDGHWETELDAPVDDEIVIPGLGRPSPLLVRRLHNVAMASWTGGLQLVAVTLMRNAETGLLSGNFCDLSAHDLVALAAAADDWN